MTVSGMNASGLNLFSTSSNSMNSMMNINFSDYNSIRSGTYYKLLKSYYAQDPSRVKETSDSFKNPASTSTSKEQSETLAKIESTADELGKSADALYNGGAKVFKKTTVTGEDGKVTSDYDKNAIYKAVDSFVEDYNSLLAAAGKSDADGIARTAASMATMTNQYADSLKELGITVDKDTFALRLDKDTFMKADMNKAKSLFNGTGSYAYGVATKASMLDYQAQREASRSNTYGSNGAYNYNYTAGSIFNNFF